MSSKRIFETLAKLEEDEGREVRGQIIDTDNKQAAPLTAGLGQMNLVARGWALKCQIEDLQEQLDSINRQLLIEVGVGHAVVLRGVARASLTQRTQVTIKEPTLLQEALGDRFDDLVTTKTTYKPEPKLLEMVSQADTPDIEIYRAALEVKTSESVTWRAEK